MSTTIDNKVVSMQFDNKNFEQNVKQSMSTLDKLKSALKFTETKESLQDLNRNVNAVDFSKMEALACKSGFHISDVWQKISTVFEYQVARKIVGAAERMTKALSLDQISQGWDKYAQKTTAVQTIMSALTDTWEEQAEAAHFAGTQMDFVSDRLDRLNWFSDETSYSFTEMTSSIGKFVSAGVGLDTSVAAIQGIATWAAKAGQNSEAASRAMYNMAQALATGSVKLIDWKSIENANMATLEFKQIAIDTAVELGTLKKVGTDAYVTVGKESEVSAKNFNEALREGWFSSKVLLKTLNEYGKASVALSRISEHYDVTATEFLGALEDYNNGQRSLLDIQNDLGISSDELSAIFEKLNSEEYKLSLSAFKAAQEAKTFAEVIDATKDAVSTSWMNIFESIFGNYEEAKAFYSDLAETFYDAFAGPLESVKTAFKLWHDEEGNRDILFDRETGAVWELIDALGELTQPIRDVMHEIFPPITVQAIKDFVSKFKEFTSQLHMSEETAENFRIVLGTLALPLKIIVELIRFGFDLLPYGVALLGQIIKNLLILGRNIIVIGVKLGIAISKSERFQRILAALRTIGGKVRDAFIRLKDAIVGFIKNAIDGNNKTLNTFFNILTKIGSVTLDGLVWVLEKLAALDLSNISEWPKEFLKNLRQLAGNSKILNFVLDVLEGIWDGLVAFKDKIVEFFTALSNNLEGASSISDFFGALKDAFKEVTGLNGTKISENFKTIGDGISAFITFVKDKLKEIPWIKLILMGFAVSVVLVVLKFAQALDSLGEIAVNLNKVVGSINDAIRKVFGLNKRLTEIKEIAIFIGVLAASLLALSFVPAEDLTRTAITLGILAGALIAMAFAMSVINKKDWLNATSTREMILIAASIAGALLMLSMSLAVLASVNFSDWKDWAQKITAILVLLAGLAAATIAISKFAPKLSTGGVILLAFAASILILSRALYDLASVTFVDINNLIDALMTTMAGFAAIAIAAHGLKARTFLPILAIALTLKLILPEIAALGTMSFSDDFKQLMNTVYQLVLVIGGLSLISSVISSLLPKEGIFKKSKSLFRSITSALLIISTSMALFALSFKIITETIDKTSTDTMIKAAALVSGFMLLTVLMSALAKSVDIKAVAKVNGGLLAMAFTMTLMAGIAFIAALLEPEQIIKGTAFVFLLSAFVMAMTAVAKGTENIDFKGLTAFVVSFGALVALMLAISILVDKPEEWENLLKAVGYMGTVLLAMFGFLFYVNKYANSVKPGPIIALTAAIAVIAGSLLLLSKFGDFSNMLDTFGVLALSLLTFAVSLIAVGKFANQINYGSIIAMTVAIAVIAGSLWLLSNYGPDGWFELAKIATAIGMVLLALGGAMKIAADSNPNLGSTIAFVAAIVAVAGGLWVLKDIPISQLLLSALSMSAVMLALGEALNIAAQSSPQLGTAIAFVAAIAVVAGSLWILKDIPAAQLLLSAVMIAGVLMIMAKAIQDVSNTYSNTAMLLVWVLDIAAIGLSLALLATFPWPSILAAGIAMSAVVLALAAAMKIVASGDMMAGIAGLLAIAATVVLVGLSLSLLASFDWTQILAAAVAIVAVVGLLALIAGIMGAASGPLAIGIGLLAALAAEILVISAAITLVMVGITLITAAIALVNVTLSLLINTVMGVVENIDVLGPKMLTTAQIVSQCILQITQAIGMGLLNIGLSIATSIAAITQTINEAIISISNTINLGMLNITIGITTALSQLLINIVAMGPLFYAAGFTITSQFVTGLWDGFKSAIGQFFNDVSSAFARFNPVAIYKSFKNAGKQTELGFRDGAQWHSTPHWIPSFLSDTESGLMNLDLSGVQSIWSGEGSSLGAGLSDAVMGGMSGLGDRVKSYLGGLLGNINGFSEVLGTTTDKNGKQVQMTVSGTKGSFDDLIGSIFGTTDAADEAGTAMEEAGAKGGGGAQKAKDKWEELHDTIKNNINIFDEFNKETDLSADKLIENMRSQISGAAEWTSWIGQLGPRGLSTGLLDELTKMGQSQGYKYAKAFMDMSSEQLAIANTLYASSLMIPDNSLFAIKQSYSAAGEWALAGFTDGITVDAAKAGMDYAGIQALNALNAALGVPTDGRGNPTGASSKTKKTGEQIVEGTKTGATDQKSKKTTELASVTVTDRYQSALQGDGRYKMEEVGHYLVSGMCSAMTDSTSKQMIDQSASSVMKYTDGSWRRKAGIESPSKMTAVIGKYLVLGLAKGIVDSSKYVEDSSQKLVDTVMDTISPMIGDVSSLMNSDIDLQPVISPVLDTTNLQSGLTGMNSMLASASINVGNIKSADYIATNSMSTKMDSNDIVASINSLKEDINFLGESISNIQMVLDTGTMVGAMTPAIDQQLYTRQVYAGRGI